MAKERENKKVWLEREQKHHDVGREWKKGRKVIVFYILFMF